MHRVPAAPEHLELAAEDALHLGLLGRLVKSERPEHVAVIGHRHRPHARRGDALDQIPDLHRPIEQRVLRMHVKVDELGGHRALVQVATGDPGRTQGARARLGGSLLACLDGWTPGLGIHARVRTSRGGFRMGLPERGEGR